jgi:hypothetical protein
LAAVLGPDLSLEGALPQRKALNLPGISFALHESGVELFALGGFVRFITLIVLFGLLNFANAKSAVDKEGNCVPELLSEHARLFSELETLDALATRCQTQLASPVKESQKLGMSGVKELGTKAVAARKEIKKFGETYGNAECKAQVNKNGKMEIVAFKVKERTATLDKLAAAYEENAAKYLKANVAFK